MKKLTAFVMLIPSMIYADVINPFGGAGTSQKIDPVSIIVVCVVCLFVIITACCFADRPLKRVTK